MPTRQSIIAAALLTFVGNVAYAQNEASPPQAQTAPRQGPGMMGTGQMMGWGGGMMEMAPEQQAATDRGIIGIAPALSAAAVGAFARLLVRRVALRPGILRRYRGWRSDRRGGWPTNRRKGFGRCCGGHPGRGRYAGQAQPEPPGSITRGCADARGADVRASRPPHVGARTLHDGRYAEWRHDGWPQSEWLQR
jgi:hypothetical protein